MEFFRNWEQICQIADPNLRLALAFVKDEGLLEGLRRGFPECFSDEPSKTPLVSASVLKQRAYEQSVEEESSYTQYHGYDREFDWYHVAAEFGIPQGPYWHYESEPVPPEVREQLVNQILRFGLRVTWEREEYLVSVFSWNHGEGANSDLGRILSVEDSQDDTMAMGLIPARFVDLNS